MSDRTQDLKNLRAVATACKNYVDETKEQILWQVGQYNITTQDDNTTAYQKVVPTGATRAKIKSIGGMSYKSENLITTFNESTGTGHTFVDGVLTSSSIDSRSWNTYNVCDFQVYLQAGTYQIKFFDRVITQDQYQNLAIVKESNTLYTSNNTIYSNESGNFQFTITEAGNYGIMLKFIGNLKPMLVSGSTAPTEYKPYFAGIRDSIVTSVKSYDSNNNLIDTYTIPDEVKALDGYGRGINENCYNVLDLEAKVFTDKDNRTTNTTNFSYVDSYTKNNVVYSHFRMYLSDNLPKLQTYNLLPSYNFDHIGGWTSSDREGTWLGQASDTSTGWTFQLTMPESIVGNTTASIQAFWTNNPLVLQYELATYNITNNLELPNNVIEVEAGGYLVFENQYGQAVPSNITYRIEVAK